MKGCNSRSFIGSTVLFLLINSYYVEAGIFLKAKDPVIIQGAVWLYSNSTAITSIAPDVQSNKFRKGIIPIENSPQASVDGTEGVLYNREDSCSPDAIEQPIPIPFYTTTAKLSKVPKIALIKKQAGNCTLTEKIKNAQLEGAVGVILYDTTTNEITSDSKSGVLPNNDITIPAFYVDQSVGFELYHQLQKMAGVPLATIPTFDDIHLTTRISVKITLMPADNVKPTAWELTLLVMLILLGTSILFSVTMHFYMWKRNQDLQNMVERHRNTAAAAAAAAAVLPMGKALLTVERLYQFPTRTVDTLPDEEERKKVQTVLSDEKQREALIKNTALSTKETKHKSVFRKTKLLVKPPSSTFVDAPVNNMCVICLEAFKIDDEVRELPCHHEYHTICIDPWLTSKSCECPLCKYDCSDHSKPSKTDTDPDGLIAAATVPGLRGKILRLYLKFKANKRRRIGQVGITNDVEQQRSLPQHQQQSQQNTMPSPPSPGLAAALRALDAIEIIALPITTELAMEEHFKALDETHNINHKNEKEAEEEEEEEEEEEDTTESIVTDIPPRQSTTTNRTGLSHQYYEEEEEEEVESELRYSIATNRDDTDTIHTTTAISVSTYAPTSDGGLLPDIDVSSISLCSIDLGGLSEDFHNTFNYQR